MTALPDVPEFPTLHADIDGTGRGRLILPDGEQTIAGPPDECGPELIRRAARYAADTLKRPVRLQAVDPHATRLFAVHPDGHAEELAPPTPAVEAAAPGQPDPTRGPEDPGGEGPAGRPPLRAVPRDSPPPSPPEPLGGSPGANPPADDPPADEPPAAGPEPHVTPHAGDPDGPPRTVGDASAPAVSRVTVLLDRHALHPDRPSRLTRLRIAIGRVTTDREAQLEEAADRELARRHTVSDTNFIMVCSNKGGPGKTAMATAIGDALASRLPNQRVLAADLNPGAGALARVAPDDRRAQKSLLELYEARDAIDRHSKMQQFIATLPSGLAILTVDPKVLNALRIRPEHYEELFDKVLIPNYDLIVLDTSPDVTNPVTQLAFERGTQMVIVLEQDFLSSSVVIENLEYLLDRPAAGPAGQRVTVVLNKVMSDPRAGDVNVTERAIRELHHGPVIRVPFDLDLKAQLSAGQYTLDAIRRRATRLPIKQLAIEVCGRFV